MPISRIATFFSAFFLSCAFFSTAATLAFETLVEPAPNSATQSSTRDQTESNFWLQNRNDFDIELNYDSYSVAEGLSQSIVTSIVEDEEGYVWIGTLNGLNRFDGTHFKHFFADDTNSGLPSSFIRSLLIDNDGQLLVGTDAGLVKYRPELETFEPLKNATDELASQPIWALEAVNNSTFIGLDSKLIIFKSNTKYEIDLPEAHEIKKIKFINGKLYIRNYDGDVYFIKESTPLKIFDNAHDIENLNGVLVISSNLGLFTHNEGDVTKISNSVLENLTSYKSTTLAVTKNDIHQLIGNSTSKKIGSLNDSEDKFKKVFIKNIKNNIYISLLNAGFIRITEAKNLNKTPLKVKGNIWSIAKTKNEIFLASDEKKISIYSHSFEFIKEIPFENTFGPKSIDILVDNLFIASKSGIYRYNLSSNESVAIYNNHTSHIEINNNALIAGTSDGEVIFFDNHNIITKKIKLDGKYPVYDILIDNDIVWIASQSGLIKHENNKNIIVFDKDLVTSIEKHNEKIVFGTRTSIYELKDISEIPILIQNNNKLVYSIKSDNNFLISTANGGINIISKDKKNIISLHQKHGAQLDYNVNSSLIDNKNIIFGGSTGLSVLNTESLNDYLLRAEKPKVVISDLSLFNTVEKIGNGVLNRSISHLDKLILKFSDYPFSFKFHVPGKAFEDLIFYYQMKGLSNDWLVAKEVNSATYTNLSHGEYKFNVYAIDKLTGKQGPTKSIKVIITPPWWLSFEAKLIYALLTLVFAGALFRTIMRRREVQRQIAQSEERLKLSLWGSGDEMWDWDIESGKIYRSNIWGTLEFPQDGQRSGDLDGESNIHPQDRDRVQEALAEHFQGETDHFEVAYRVKNRHGEWLWILDRAKIVERDNNERPLRMTGTIKDINNIKQTEEQLRLFARAIENISEGMFILDANHLFVEVNSACCSLLQRAKSTFTGELLSFNLYPESFSTQIRSIITQQGYWSGDVDALKGDGSTFLMSLTIDAIKDELGQFSHYVGIFSDITRRKQQEEELRKLTNNDILTGLANRSSLQVTLSNLVKKDIHHTLMVLDLDNFKRINDSLGHQIGDSLIINVAERIQTTIPSHASLYRLGGDEFAILLDKDPDIASSAAIALSIIEALKTPFIIESEQLVIGISIGIVLYPEDEQNEQALLRKADIAMYHAKSAGGNRYQFYAESLNQNVLRQLEVENFIRQGLKDDLFEVHYQAKVDLKLDRITGMEALVRLNHPQFGLIPPNDFIPLAEENGLIIEIGEIVLTKACSAAQSWRQQGLFNGRIAVNLSSKQFALPDLVQRIESILRLTGLPAAHLELEITEGTVIKNPESAIKVMQQLSKMGISLALDDFGTGYSSLSYLKRFPIHRLKVDKSFVDDIDKSDMDLKMVDSIITIAHNMGLTVVGEGVEQAAQLSILKALNCEEIQGYIFSKPIPESEFTRLLTNDINRNSFE